MNIDLSGLKALVTGGSTGIGRAAAIALAKAGAEVALTYRSREDEAVSAVAEIESAGGQARAFGADLANAHEAKNLVEHVTSEFGGLDILVNNAGSLVQRAAIEEIDHELWHRIMGVNLHSAFYCTQTALPYLKKSNNGRIINLGSIAGHTGGGGGSVPYATSKGAIHTFTRGLARELAPTGITVNAISPGVIDTPFHEQFTPPERYQELAREVPLGRAGTPEETAVAIVFLVSPQARYITGEIIEVNGGQLMR